MTSAADNIRGDDIKDFLSSNSLHNVDDFELAAQKKLSKPLYEYLASGSDAEETLHENRIAFSRYALRPFALRSVSGLSTALSLFGRNLSIPVFASPAGVHRLVNDKGECATARACGAVGTMFGLSQHATCSIEEVARVAPGTCRWFQCYILKERSVTASLVRRAVKAGYSGIFLTVDSVKFGRREADARNGFNALPPPLTLSNYEDYAKELSLTTDQQSSKAWERKKHAAWDQNTETIFDQDASWDDITWLRTVIDAATKDYNVQGRIPLVIKGIMTAEDAIKAVDFGADGIMVSNHGGRQLDGCLASIDALPEVVAAVRSKRPGFPVLLDSGIRRGTDVVKALALGATAVGVGKPLFYSLATGGELGVSAMFHIFKEEIETAMALCGCRTIADVSGKMVQRRSHL
eukprot:CAMPEP_0171298840 /NCGR_PEP_ID=MMETSP0816-20121228/7628_1 /TAXON_ID=420281 /ORGANISM="Proboscia inermis, Strain CCAP1064/1" /LENGTH=406 /DNA_ID=CAMNT_0011774175 /DNA_START=125 /DNA_END=1345 /DNA_ORIENTATION=+